MKIGSAEAFLKYHRMHPALFDIEELAGEVRLEMHNALEGDYSSLAMQNSYLTAPQTLPRGETVLALDAGGTNLRAARIRYTPEGGFVTEALEKRPMPGIDCTVTAQELWHAMAELALKVYTPEIRRCGVCFSFACDMSPNGDGVVTTVSKGLRISGLVGSYVCYSIEKELQKLGCPGMRRWQLLNDTVGALLGGMAVSGRFGEMNIGLVIGTGFNTCCSLVRRGARDWKDTNYIYNMESGCFNRLPRGDGDLALDALPDITGSAVAEKMIAGKYYPTLLRETLLLACDENELSPATRSALQSCAFTGPLVDELSEQKCPRGLESIPGEEMEFIFDINALLLERGAILVAAILLGCAREMEHTGSTRLGIYTDGSMILHNKMLQDLISDNLRTALRYERRDVLVDWEYTADTTILGCAFAAMIS